MSTSKTVEETERLLDGQRTAPTHIKEGKFEYIKWSDSVRELNRIFGELGWSDEHISTTRLDYGFETVVRITLFLPNGQVRHHDGKGYGTIGYVDEKDSYGKELKPSSLRSKRAQAEDKAVKEAYSDALSRACKRWTALGLALYGGDEGTDLSDEGETSKPVTAQRTTQPQHVAAETHDAAPLPIIKADPDGTYSLGKVRNLLNRSGYKTVEEKDAYLYGIKLAVQMKYTAEEWRRINEGLRSEAMPA